MEPGSAPAQGSADDLTIRVAHGRTLDELVDFVLSAERDSTPTLEVLETLTVRFGLSFDDARLAVDRVEGGRVRAGHPSNEPDPAKDPVAHLAYCRSRGAPTVPTSAQGSQAWSTLIQTLSSSGAAAARAFLASNDPKTEADPHERESAELWCHAIDAMPGGTRPARSVPVALGLLTLAKLTIDSSASAATKGNVLVQLGTALAGAIDDCIERRGERTHAEAGTDTWFDAIAVGEACRELGGLFACIGEPKHEMSALRLQGRVTTRLLGHCYERVGRAMLDSAKCALRLGNTEDALGFCGSLIDDLSQLVLEPWAAAEERPFDEHRLALQHLVAAVDLRSEIRGGMDAEAQSLRARCTALLEDREDPR